ncbi:hypothetical protein EUGRSUZ_F00635 [Eucalyptus grandis]|uniref:Uncharacterized protein n=2 Tax=Eucalyptus grandis TaxID=71139 RepID=A0ACC3KCN7_EUCGR|nr:hypothetical protein EUGRSUZ_F00635 [Eucalyptus grandis]
MAMTLRELAANLGTEHAQVVPITVFVAVLCLCLVVGHLLEENRWVNESITAILIGCLSGTIILVLSKGKNSHILTFNEELFFIYLLPPIIFNAGFQVKKKQFFQNFFTIMLFGVVLHQDETPLLYSLVFGEGVVNDATSVVLFNAVQKLDVTRLDSKNALHIIGDFLYLFSTSTGLGVIAGLLTSFCLKMLYFGRHSSVREIALMVLMAYLSYMLAELLELSGILTVFFCGILMSHYAWHNVTESSRITTRHVEWHVFAMMSFVAETFIFLYVGMDALDIEKWKMTKLRDFTRHLRYLTYAYIGRPCCICVPSFTYSGVTSDPVNATMVTNTIIVVLFSTLVCTANGQQPREAKMPKEDMTVPMLSMEESAATNILRAKDSLSMLIERPVHTIHSYWRKFDDAYMRPIFGGPCRNNSVC